MGPNSGLGHNSMIFIIEAQARHAVQLLQALRDQPLISLNVRADTQSSFNVELQAKLQNTVWRSGCKSWYLADTGRNASIWPGATRDYWRRTRTVQFEDFVRRRTIAGVEEVAGARRSRSVVVSASEELTQRATSRTIASMCLEKQSISAALGDDTSATLDVDRPILRVDDPRLELDDPMMQRRRKVLAVLGKNFPMTLALADVQAHGLEAPYGQGSYKAMKGADGSQNSCAPINAYIMHLLGASEVWGFGVEWGGWGTKEEGFKPKRSTPQDGWVSYAPGRLPSVGDVFILYEELAPGLIGAGHCGVVCQASLNPDEFWITGDGGQPDRTGDLHQRPSGRWMRSYNKPDPDYPPDAVGEKVPGTQVTWRLKAHEAAYLVPRKLDCTDPRNPLIANYFTGGGGETLHGWRSVTHPKITFKNGVAYDETGSKQDYEEFKAKILNVDKLAKAEAKLRADIELLGY